MTDIEKFAVAFGKQSVQYENDMEENPQDYHELTIKQVQADTDLALQYGFKSKNEAADALIKYYESLLK